MNQEMEIRPGRHLNVEISTHSASKPTAFLIHGLGGRGEQWREQIPILAQKYNLVIPDLLGHGKSAKPKPGKTNPYSFLEHSQDLELLFEKFATSENIILGHSYGGALATLLAFNHQSKVKQLTLMSPMPCIPLMSIPGIYHLPLFLLEWLRPLLEKNFQQAAFAPTDNPSLIEVEAAAGKNNRLYVIKAMLLGARDIPALDMKKLHLPASVFLGESDKIIPVESGKAFYEVIPEHQIYILKNASHMVMLEQPGEVNELLLGPDKII